tara:strand:- start:1257 stop:1610 length:354 start_codon:yes stop_codon:yes gene_type:complete
VKDKKSSPWDFYDAIDHTLYDPEDDATVFMEEGRAKSPELNFVRHYFLSAITDCFSEDPSIKREARKWVGSEDESYVLSFRSTCSILHLDYSAVRVRVQQNNNIFEPGDLRELRNAS